MTATLYTHSCGGATRKYYLYHPGADTQASDPSEAVVYFALTAQQARDLKTKGTLPDLRSVPPVSMHRCECTQSGCAAFDVVGYDPYTLHPNDSINSATKDKTSAPKKVVEGVVSASSKHGARDSKGQSKKDAPV